MNETLFIPTKCKVGFNTRKDTYTGKLGYVIYHDGKTWRKEKSWEGWREKYVDDGTVEKEKRKQYEDRVNYITNNDYYKTHYTDEKRKELIGTYEDFQPNIGKISDDPTIEPVEFENKPTEGFVLNKKMGGVSGYRSWYDHDRIEKVRIYDPRGFEFEITIPNLLFILQECNAYKGKGLEGEFVYAWQGAELILIPVSCKEYQDSIEYTKLQLSKLSVKELAPGCSYVDKHKSTYVYLGKFEWYERQVVAKKELAIAGSEVDTKTKKRRRRNYDDYYKPHTYVANKYHIFIDEKQLTLDADKKSYLVTNSMTSFAKKVSDNVISNYGELVQDFSAYRYAQKPIELKEEKASFDLSKISLNYRDYKRHSSEKNIYIKKGEKYYVASIQSVHAHTESVYDYKTGKYTQEEKYEFAGYGVNLSEKAWIENGVLHKQVADYDDRVSYSDYFNKKDGYNKVLFTKEQIESMDFVKLTVIGEFGTETKIENY